MGTLKKFPSHLQEKFKVPKLVMNSFKIEPLFHNMLWQETIELCVRS